MTKRKPDKPEKPKPARRRYTEADIEAVRDARRAGATLEDAAAAIDPPCSVDTARRWCRGITVVRTAPTEKQVDAAAQARAARRDAMLERRANLSDDLLGKLTPAAVTLLAERLAEQADLIPVIAADEARLEEAILALEALAAGDDKADPSTREELAVKNELRRQARQRVMDARLVLAAHRDARIAVRDLVGVLTRAIADHLTLEGDAAEALAADREVAVIFTAPTADRRRPVVVQLNAAGEAIGDDGIDVEDLTDA